MNNKPVTIVTFQLLVIWIFLSRPLDLELHEPDQPNERRVLHVTQRAIGSDAIEDIGRETQLAVTDVGFHVN